MNALQSCDPLSFLAGSELRWAADTAGLVITATFPGLLGMSAGEGTENIKSPASSPADCETCHVHKDSQGLSFLRFFDVGQSSKKCFALTSHVLGPHAEFSRWYTLCILEETSER